MAIRDDVRAFGRDLLLLLGIPFVILVGLLVWWAPWVPATYQVPEGASIFDAVAGRWDWSDADSLCVADSHEIGFAENGTVMVLTYARPWTDSAGVEHQASEYDILEHSRSHIRGAIRGETRLTADGVPVVWDLVLTSAESYAWHRTDWASWGRTKEVVRCLDEEDDADAIE